MRAVVLVVSATLLCAGFVAMRVLGIRMYGRLVAAPRVTGRLVLRCLATAATVSGLVVVPGSLLMWVYEPPPLLFIALVFAGVTASCFIGLLNQALFVRWLSRRAQAKGAKKEDGGPP